MNNQACPMNLILKERNSLWLGDIRAAKNIEQLIYNNIKSVVTITSRNRLKYPEEINQYYFQLEDIPDQKIDQIFEKTSEHSVLVHCSAGISRSTTIVLVYLMKFKKWSLKQAFLYVQTIRPIVNPNVGFQQLLLDYWKQLESVQKKKKNDITINSSEEEKLEYRISLARKTSYYMVQKDNRLSLNKAKSETPKKIKQQQSSYLSIYKQLEQNQQKSEMSVNNTPKSEKVKKIEKKFQHRNLHSLYKDYLSK